MWVSTIRRLVPTIHRLVRSIPALFRTIDQMGPSYSKQAIDPAAGAATRLPRSERGYARPSRVRRGARVKQSPRKPYPRMRMI